MCPNDLSRREVYTRDLRCARFAGVGSLDQLSGETWGRRQKRKGRRVRAVAEQI